MPVGCQSPLSVGGVARAHDCVEQVEGGVGKEIEHKLESLGALVIRVGHARVKNADMGITFAMASGVGASRRRFSTFEASMPMIMSKSVKSDSVTWRQRWSRTSPRRRAWALMR